MLNTIDNKIQKVNKAIAAMKGNNDKGVYNLITSSSELIAAAEDISRECKNLCQGMNEAYPLQRDPKNMGKSLSLIMDSLNRFLVKTSLEDCITINIQRSGL